MKTKAAIIKQMERDMTNTQRSIETIRHDLEYNEYTRQQLEEYAERLKRGADEINLLSWDT